MTNFTLEQKDYIQSTIDDHVYLEACPGSGKTEVVAAKVAKEISNWKKDPSGIAILSFSNSATDELKDRIGKFSTSNLKFHPHFIGTFDSFIYKYIVSPVAHKITKYSGTDDDYAIRIVESTSSLFIQTKYQYAGRGKLKANHYSYNSDSDIFSFHTGDKIYDQSLEAMTFEHWQKKDLLDTKKKFLKAGFSTYSDIELLAIAILNDVSLSGFSEILTLRFPLIIIDECQDLGKVQISILHKLASFGVKLHFIGDLNQSIYAFRNSEPDNVLEFTKELGFELFPLTKNHRSVQPIVNLCNTLVAGANVIGRTTNKTNHCIVLEYSECPTEVLPTFTRLSKPYNNNVIIARGHTMLNKFNTSANKLNEVQKLALAITLFDINNFDRLEKSITLFSQYLRTLMTESVKPLSFNCPVSIDSPLKWRTFLFNALIFLAEDNLNDSSLTWKVWTGKAKLRIKGILKQSFVDDDIAVVLNSLSDCNIRSPNKLGQEALGVSLKIVNTPICLFRKETVHQVKGETHDVSMFVSSAGKQGAVGANWKEWLADPNSEYARLAYVASSRPKELLIWAVKKLKSKEKAELESIGFDVIPLDD
ncbi:UvrD-helicase domain-containing protein [Colwellia sp. E150_009]